MADIQHAVPGWCRRLGAAPCREAWPSTRDLVCSGPGLNLAMCKPVETDGEHLPRRRRPLGGVRHHAASIARSHRRHTGVDLVARSASLAQTDRANPVGQTLRRILCYVNRSSLVPDRSAPTPHLVLWSRPGGEVDCQAAGSRRPECVWSTDASGGPPQGLKTPTLELTAAGGALPSCGWRCCCAGADVILEDGL